MILKIIENDRFIEVRLKPWVILGKSIKTMRLRHYRKFSSNPTVESLKQRLSLSIAEAPNYINKIRAAKTDILYDKFNSINTWYTKVLGLDQVRACQDKVTALQDQLLISQEKRREIARQLAEVREKSNEVQDELHKVKRQENLERYLDLMKKETEILKMEHSISRTFQEYDQTERELFTAFTNAIRDSHEKQRAQLEYTKYFGVVLSIIGSFLTFTYSTFRKQDIKRYLEQKFSTFSPPSQSFLELMESNQHTLRELENVVKDLKKAKDTEIRRAAVSPSPIPSSLLNKRLKPPETRSLTEEEAKQAMDFVYSAIVGIFVIYVCSKLFG